MSILQAQTNWLNSHCPLLYGEFMHLNHMYKEKDAKVCQFKSIICQLASQIFLEHSILKIKLPGWYSNYAMLHSTEFTKLTPTCSMRTNTEFT